MIKIDSFKVIGISTRTTNEEGRGAIDMRALWGRFYAENIPGKISNKITDEVYSIYTDYESDYKGEYEVMIGLKVDSLITIPNGLIGREFKGGKHQRFTAKGEMPKAVVETWQEIWQKDQELNRAYTADFEVYGAKSQNGENSEVEIFIAIK